MKGVYNLFEAALILTLGLASLTSCEGNFEPCHRLDCGDHGSCFSDGSHAVCVCEPGFTRVGALCVPLGPDGDGDSDLDEDLDEDLDDDDEPCSPSCAGRECGSDGCGGNCGDCGPEAVCDQVEGQCCVPGCEGRLCGPDGCGGFCGGCATWEVCVELGYCVTIECVLGAGFGAPCEVETTCADGSSCFRFETLTSGLGFCRPACDTDDDCLAPQGFTGTCSEGWCWIFCGRCPCGLICQPYMGPGGTCHP